MATSATGCSDRGDLTGETAVDQARATPTPIGARRTALVVQPADAGGELRELLVAAGVPERGIRCAASVVDALTALASELPGAILIDARSRTEEGLELLDELLAFAPGCAAVVVADADVAEGTYRGASAQLDWSEIERGELRRVLDGAWSAEGRIRGVDALYAHMLAVGTAIDAGILIFSPAGRVLEANAAAQSILGYSREQLRFSDLLASDFRWTDDAGKVLGAREVPAAVALRTGRPVPPTMQRIERPDGSWRWIECAATPLVRDGGGAPYGVVASFRDVTQQRATHEALLGAERRQNLLLEQAAEGHLVLDSRGRVTEASASIARYWSLDSIVGVDGRELLHPDDSESMRRLFVWVVAQKGASIRTELRIVDSAGALHWAEVTLTDRLAEPAISGVVLNVRDITERKLVEASMTRLSAIVESSSDSIVGITLDGLVSSWNPASEHLYGHSAAYMIGREAHLIVADSQRDRLTELLRQVAGGEHVYVPVIDAVRSDGSPFELSLSISPVYDDSAELIGASSIGRDIAERRQLERERRIAEERFRLGFENGAIGMIMFDLDGIITRVNAALCALLDRSEEDLLGRQAEDFVHPDDVAERRSMMDELIGGSRDTLHGERRLVRSDASTVWTLVDVALVRDEAGDAAYVFGQLQDITDQKRSERALEQQALHDSLTGLPNRLSLQHRLERALVRARLAGTKVAVLFVDVDRFKLVNDGLGHVAGDRLLVELAGRLARGVRSGDTVARFGGDEFIVVCEDVADVGEADLLGDRILAMLDDPLVVGAKELRLSVSCGIAVVDGWATAEEALRDADAAMYRAKEKGRARTEIFDEGLRHLVTHRFEVEQALRTALDRGELRVAYQPIVTIPDGELVGVEALVRWQHPERGLLKPAEFIPVAEESGLIVPLGEHVLREALAQVVRWQRTLPGCEQLWVSVNFSSRQLNLGDPVALCAQMLEDTGASARALRLELTESAVMADVELSISRLEALRALGVTVAIDDFGTGYSSLSYLSRLPVDLLKIDHSFVAGLGRDGGDSEIVRAIVLLAQGLEVEVCAEGVEELAQLAELAGLGCELGQGYYWSRPLTPEAFESWVRERLVTAVSPLPTPGAQAFGA
ncbi:MAG: diguanylate cyclase/phosphodiesterase with and sensor(s) [Acidimicrobiaceae bacterium]|jgi:diguanylate cyclase (GGDEF)-like protein/PAS domain S-box-containing protein|nr:diguanylate cyclase/phosphodiesterase with and sensor(s) [Acidimicrobiaceae bacterium]